MTNPILLLDGDVVAYKFAYAAERRFEWEPGQWTYAADLEPARSDMIQHVRAVEKAVGADGILVAMSSPTNFRKALYGAYKANRTATKKPLILSELRDALMDTFESLMWPDVEADDVIGVTATTNPDTYIVASIDKDFLSIPGKHYDLNHKTQFSVTQQEADYWHMIQTLTGDAVDNYPGCPGIGSVRAEKLLSPVADNPAAMWAVVVNTFTKAGLSEEEALTQARLARILRRSEWDFDQGKPILWQPPAPQS